MLNSFYYEIEIHSTLIMVHIRTQSTGFTIDGSYGEIISASQDRTIRWILGRLKEK